MEKARVSKVFEGYQNEHGSGPFSLGTYFLTFLNDVLALLKKHMRSINMVFAFKERQLRVLGRKMVEWEPSNLASPMETLIQQQYMNQFSLCENQKPVKRILYSK